MEIKIGNTIISLIKGDITNESLDAIVNAANSRLAGGGGVDGAIHRAGGPTIMEECRKIGGCPTGSAVITSGGDLKARFVVHAVGPIYRDGMHNEAKLLESAYKKSLEIAGKNGLYTIAFPSISTGAYAYPVKEASKIALKTVIKFVEEHNEFKLIRFVLFSVQDMEVYKNTLEDLLNTIPSVRSSSA